ncbi:hypothetical protein BDZ85DRAFT_321940 [Elsinoe ampelina]|uniref:Mid2 domain-containing protein n=1 Tax=Elsinoe ampelina TaxID=302913 RepID=A0A6A6G340_9PEZI|nr:hypothetical protein BDZ85DRAFT_321940 [Elsinoe ampelina]
MQALLPLPVALILFVLTPSANALAARQVDGLATTCGYIEGNANAPITCPLGNVCSTATVRFSPTSVANLLACCLGVQCAYRAAVCAPYSSDLCTETGQSPCIFDGDDGFRTQACPSLSPNCLTLLSPDQATAFLCAPSPTSTPLALPLRPTTSGQTLLVPGATATANPAIPTTRAGSGTSPSTSTSPSSSPAAETESSGLSTGTIAGISIAGFLFLAAAIGAGWCVIKKRKRRERLDKLPLDAVPPYVPAKMGSGEVVESPHFSGGASVVSGGGMSGGGSGWGGGTGGGAGGGGSGAGMSGGGSGWGEGAEMQGRREEREPMLKG